jgi:hypothetical protein
MQRSEYKVIPAPAKGRKAPGIKGAGARFAHGLETVINEMAAQGWAYLRADILPSEERQGLATTQTVYRSVLVFHRCVEDAAPAPLSEPTPAATAATPDTDPEPPAAPLAPVTGEPAGTGPEGEGDTASETADETAAPRPDPGRGG